MDVGFGAGLYGFDMKRFEFKIHGPIKGGKNQVQITRTGHRYPNPKWEAWRNQVVREIIEVCKPTFGRMITGACKLTVIYTPNDLKRRDTPAMLDSIYHCMEKAGLIEDDFQIQTVHWIQEPKDVKKSGAYIILEEILK